MDKPTQTTNGTLNSSADAPSDPLAGVQRLRDNIARVAIGQSSAVDTLIRAILARGHVLIEDVPGVGKTVLATALARSLGCPFNRIQLTPDMLPADVLGGQVYQPATGSFIFKPGPIFASIVLADEINRTTPRTQSALLEAMSESTVSVDGVSHPLGAPFMVIATQNPQDFEGTYPLPENQLDRFLMRIALGYPTPEQESRVLELRPGETRLPDLHAVLSPDEILELQKRTDAVRISEEIRGYIIELANASRSHAELRVGLSPRGTLALAHAARASAVLGGRDHCIPEDIYENILQVVPHRVVTRGHHTNADAAHQIISDLRDSIAAPF